MPSLAIRRSTITSLTPKQRKLLKAVLLRLDMGEPADFTAPGGVRWFVWDDSKINIRDLAALGTLAGRFSEAATAIEDSDENPRAALREFVTQYWNISEPPENTANPWQWVLTNNNAPATLQAASGVPETWQPTA